VNDKIKEFWSLNEGTFYCLYDSERTSAFKKAIKNTVRLGDIVLEMGAGSGILSMFACDAGAKKVYAIELDHTNVVSLKESLALNGYSDRVVVIEGDATSIKLPEKVDVIICEMIATGLIEELQIPAMNNAIKFARKEVRVILQEYEILVDLVKSKNNFHSKNFQIIRYEFPDKTSLRSQQYSNQLTLRKVDFRAKNTKSFLNESLEIKISKDGEINGVRISGKTVFSDKSTFGYSLSYSFPIILPIDPQVVAVGDTYKLDISYSMCEGPRKLKYSLRKV